METLETLCELNVENKDSVENLVKNTHLKMTNLGRTSKLSNILNIMKIHEIVLGGEPINIDKNMYRQGLTCEIASVIRADLKSEAKRS